MTIRELRILPPFAIGRLGSANEPLDNFTMVEDPDKPLGFRKIVGEKTFVVDDESGEISRVTVPNSVEFKTDGRIRPVAPFLEVWALVDNETTPQPLTLALLKRHGATPKDIAWTVKVGNRKVERRTANKSDRVDASAGPFSDHTKHRLEGHCKNFLSAKHFIDFGTVRYIRPNDAHPEIRLRFMPAKGLIYGPKLDEKEIQEMRDADPSVKNLFVVPKEQAVYDKRKGWWRFSIPPAIRNADPNYDGKFYSETQPPALFAIIPPGPCWLNDNIAVSRGYFDDACDGFVEVTFKPKKGRALSAIARLCASPPALVPDSLFVRSLADDLDQVIWGPAISPDEAPEVTRARAEDIVRRAYETVRFLNVSVMNGNSVEGRDPLDIDTMPAEEAFDVYRTMRPVFSPPTADTLAIMGLHQQVYAAMRAGAAPWFPSLLRKPNEVGDFTDNGRRKMPALMCGADGNYLALTHRQIRTIYKAAGQPVEPPDPDVLIEADMPQSRLVPRNQTASRATRIASAVHHVAQGNPVSSRPITSIGNCTPGLEVDFRFVWRRVFDGIVLREYDNLVMEAENPKMRHLVGHRLLKVSYPGPRAKGKRTQREFLTMTTQIGPNPYDTANESVVLSFEASPHGLAPLEWSNLLALMLHERAGQTVTCHFSKEESWWDQVAWHPEDKHITRTFAVREFFDGDSGVIAPDLAKPGELTMGLCSPWQNDYRECSCYYWASARPDFVNVAASTSGLSVGDNWLQKVHNGSYVPDDYSDARLILYDDLFNEWEKWLRFAIEGKDAPGEPKA
ncbi:MAG: hypothetical protein AABZ80_00355 [Gemmatimonadota bacterium]